MSLRLNRKRLFTYAQKCIVGFLTLLLFLSDFTIVPLPLFFDNPGVETAHAIGGDFSIYRSASTASVPASGSEVEMVWDTVVTETSGIDLQSGSTTIDLSEGGKYLVMYNAWAEEVGGGGENRRAFESYLTLNESELTYGRGAGYIRDNNNDDNYAYTNGAAIIDASPGDDLEINIRRDDTNANDQTQLRADTNGVSVLKLKDDFDYARIPKTSNSVDISGITTFTDVTWDTVDELDTGSFGYTSGSSNITLKGDDGDHFLLTYNVRLEQTAGSGERQNYESRLTLDGAEIPGTRVTTYPRGNASSNGIYFGTLAYAGIIQKTSSADQTLNIEVRQENVDDGTPPATVIVGNQTGLSLVALPDSAYYVMLTSTSTQSVPNTQAPIDFDEQIEINSNAFSHSTTTNPSRVNFDLDGDYLFFSNVYATRSNTGSGDRDPYRVEWRLDGSNTIEYGGHGSFLRGNQGTQDSYAGGSSGGLILPNITDTQYLEVTMHDEEDNADAELEPANIAIQGVELSLLFQTNVEVSATSSHVATAQIPQTGVYQGGAFVIKENTGTRNVTDVILTESGSINAATGLENIELYYEYSTSSPYDCSEDSYDGDETQFGDTDANGFSGADGVSSFTQTGVSISTTQSLCLYVLYDVTSSANDSETIAISVDDPSTDVSVTNSGSVGPNTVVAPAGQTTLSNPELTQIHYHWRNDDGSESAATSVDGTEDTPAGGFAVGTQRRLRIEVSAEGSGDADPAQFRLQFAEKSGTCAAATGWEDVADVGGAWDIGDSTNLNFADDATNIGSAALGAVSDEESNFNGTSTIVDGGDKSVDITILNDEFAELEYTVISTAAASEGTTYCFRLVDESPDVTHPYRIPLTIQSSEVGSNLTDFPVYVDLSTLGAHFFSNVASDGGDIRVTTADGGTEVAREIVDIDTGGGSGELHFLAPDISSSANTTFYIYYGAAGENEYQASSTYGGTNVWDPNYAAVYHLEDSGTTYLDSTSNGYNGVGEVTDPSLTTGQLSGAQSFGANGRIDLGTGPSIDLNAAGEYYVSVWLNLNTSDGDQSPVSQYTTGGDFLFWADTGSSVSTANGASPSFCQYNGSYLPADCRDLTNQNPGSWQYVAAYHTGTAAGVYLDGVETGTGPTVNTFAVNATERFAIGAQNGDSTLRYFNGLIDEVRIGTASFGADWSAAEFSNQDTPTTFYATSSYETLSGTPANLTYDVYPEANITSDIVVSASSTQVASLNTGATNQYVGGTFVVERPGADRTLNSITITETGSVDATLLANPTLYYDIGSGDCTGQSYSGLESSISGSAFSGPNGSTTFSSINEVLNTTNTFCGYMVFDIGSTATDSETINVEITNPSIDVAVSGSSVGPSTAVSPTGSTTIAGPILTQTGYHWRNDDDNEVDASSATADTENTALFAVPRNTTYRLRYQVSNEGTVSSNPTQFQLEYQTKVGSCAAGGSWQSIDVGSAFTMESTSQLVDGNNTTDVTSGGIGNPGGKTFQGTNGGQKEDDDTTAAVTLSSTQFTELEYALQATDFSGYDTTYCFRLTDNGTPLLAYSEYAELTTREKQDFFVQRGTLFVTGTGTVLRAGVDYAAPTGTSTAFVRITNTHHTGAGHSSQGTQNADDVTAFIADQSDITNSFTIGRPTTSINSTRVSWEILEYTGLNGADNEIRVRDVGSSVFANLSLTATGSVVTSVSDDSDVVVFITGQMNPSTTTVNYMAGLSTSEWNSTTSEPVFRRGQNNIGDVEVSYAVVEFTGLNWRVQRAEHTYISDTVPEDENITAVNSLSRTFIHAQKRIAGTATGLDDFGHMVSQTSIGSVTFELNSGTDVPSDHTSVAWVIENTQIGDGSLVVARANNSVDANQAVEPRINTFTYDSGSTNNLSNTSIFGSNDSTGGGTAYPRAILGLIATSTDGFEIFESDAGQTQRFEVMGVQWPVAELAWQQNYYRFYVDSASTTVDDPWPVGGSDLGENESITGANDPLGEGERVRIRMNLLVNNASFPEGTVSFKLQYGRRDGASCSAISTWEDVGAAGSGEIWRGYDNTPVDGDELNESVLSSSVLATYEEENNSVVNPNFADVDQTVEYDWLIEHNGATQRSDYCFRMVESDGTELVSYNNYPTLRTTGYTPVVGDWRWYSDVVNETPATPLANENAAPTDIALDDLVKLRVLATEVEGASGSNVKFRLQYSQFPNFSDGGSFVVATSSCGVTSTWCYADGAGIDNQIISTTTLTNADACTLGVGPGCGNHNEAPTTTTSLSQTALSNMEFEYTIRHAGARANGVYYFRLYDTTNDDALAASSSFPSLVTEGAQLVFTNTGLPAGTSTEGITTDIESSTTTIAFGSLAFGSEFEGAYRLAVDTNATEGYQVLMVTDQELQNTYGDPVPAISGSNAVPVGWSTGCSGQSSCFGYHSGDDSLFGGSARFAPDDSYAAINPGVPEEVAYSAVPVNETHDIVYKVEVGEEQVAGDYSMNVTFIAVPVY